MNTQIQATHAGYYQTNEGQSFMIIQSEVGSSLVSGKDCLIRYFTNQQFIKEVDSVLLKISSGQEASRDIFIPCPGLFPDDSTENGPSLGMVLKAFLIEKSGLYTITCLLLNMYGHTLLEARLPELYFSHDIDYFINSWIPHGLVI